MFTENNNIFGITAEFKGPAELIEAAKIIRHAGYKNFDCYSPFPVHGMDQAMGLKRSPLGFIVAIVSFFIMIGTLTLQWWTNAVDYPLIISGKPLFSYQTYAPVAFGVTIAIAAFTAVIGMLLLNKLPAFFHPQFSYKRFYKATDDGFFITVESDDPNFDVEKTSSLLESVNGSNIEVLKNE